MPAGSLADAQTIAHDVAAILELFIADLEKGADLALQSNRIDDALALRTHREELSRQADRLRDI